MTENNTPAAEKKGAGTYQMLWNCKFCGTEKLLGVEHRHCPSCGAPQDPERRYFPKEEDMVAVAEHQFVGADKVCPACRQPNSAASAHCQQCGADLATGETVATFGRRDLGAGIATTDTRRDVEKEKWDAEMARVQAEEVRQPIFLGLNKRQVIIGSVIALIAVIMIGIVFAVTYRRSTSGTVTALTWERVIEIESFQQISDSAWDESVPPDAYGERCERRQHGTEKVEVGSHEECSDVDQGDGSFRRECRTVKDYENQPVYDDWCSYTVDRWRVTREVKANGSAQNDPPPSWPGYTLAGGAPYGEEREGSRHETYRVMIEHGGDEDTCAYDQAKWESFTVGMAVDMEVDLRGKPDCGSVKATE